MDDSLLNVVYSKDSNKPNITLNTKILQDKITVKLKEKNSKFNDIQFILG